MKTDDPTACRWCGAALAEREPGRGGRPRVVHPGECSRLYNNKRRLDWRCERFRAAHRVDRSDVLPMPDGYGIDQGDLDSGWQEARVDWDGTPIPRAVLEAWEAQERTRKLVDGLRRIERAAAAQAHRELIQPGVDAAVTAILALPDAKRTERLRTMVAARQARTDRARA